MKQAISAKAGADLIPDGAVLMIGGFMGVGSPHRLIDALLDAGRRGLTVIANDAARPGLGIGKLLSAGALTRIVASHIGLNPEAQKGMMTGDLQVDLVPQGTLAERIRAAGFGLGGVLTRTGLGTLAEDAQTIIEIGGERFLYAPPLKADFALIACHRADYLGNSCYQLTATNFNPVMAMAGDVVICEPREIVPVGMIPPDVVATPGALVDHLIERAP